MFGYCENEKGATNNWKEPYSASAISMFDWQGTNLLPREVPLLCFKIERHAINELFYGTLVLHKKKEEYHTNLTVCLQGYFRLSVWLINCNIYSGRITA